MNVDITSLTAICSGLWIYLLIGVVTTVLYLIYSHLTGSESWEKYGVKHVNNFFLNFRLGIEVLLAEHGETVGIKRSRLVLITKDLSLLKEVMIKDFNNFIDRPQALATFSPVAKSVLFLGGQDWKRVRHIITPSFSTGKLKNIVKHIDSKALKLSQVLEQCARKDQLVPIKHLTGQYTSEIIAKTAFGFNSECLGENDDEFTYYSKNLFKFKNKVFGLLIPLLLRFVFLQHFLVKKLKVTFLDNVWGEADRYLRGVLQTSIQGRLEAEQKGQIVPNDLLQSLINAQKTGENQHDEDNEDKPDTNNVLWNSKLSKTLSEEEVIAQSLLIIFAGLETTSTTLQMCYYMLAKHPDVQDKVYEEIENNVHLESPTYEELSQLTYMEQVINETLRMYPPAAIVSRVAAETKTYGNITIPKGAGVVVPIFAILKDPNYYPDPEQFNPERFNEVNKANRDHMTFMPFGYGPRQCIGMRLAYLELKIALVHSIRKVRFELNERTEPKKGESPKLRGQAILVEVKPLMLSVSVRS